MENAIPNWLLQRAYLTPNRTALVFGNQIWTFSEMVEEVRKIANRLHVQRGERVAVLVKNNPTTVWLIHALQQCGAEIVFLNNRLTSAELLFQLIDSKAKKLIFDDSMNVIASDIAKNNKDIYILSLQRLASRPVKCFEEKLEFHLNDICSIMYTSGTTGKPKGVLQTYGNHWWSAIGSSLNLGLREDDAWLCAVPLFHISGMSILMRSVIYGMPVYLQEQFNEYDANTLLKSGKVTIMSVVSAMLDRMLLALGDEKYDERFRCMLLGGGAAQRHQLEWCKRKGIPVIQTYGMTETASQIVTLSPEDSLEKLGSAGKPLFPAQLQIVTENGKQAEHGEVGEIIVKGPNVTSGYLQREDANKEAFQNGWFRTGDLGYLDEEGFLYILDRRSDLIISGGENIYPAEIEEVLMEIPEVMEAGVTGVNDAVWGKVPYAFVVLSNPLSEQNIIEFCRGKLASYKMPKRIYQIEALPRNGANKIVRRQLLQYIKEDQ
ncbi:o-succinylbenzoate--CoA ligase [Bacillus sp. FJAT-50079]|uniref:o-succinylbenzoate--CoA ligase n=1 Tax=Bacillus sp. FJAT-50079 TaxID=2833577 RepID=UPI001BC8E8E0|nr:o-succinylbenzoate--CoA ligase [Bacillus sp. FJAT-50079]MBS4208581.1 o-succinylbenzoate--CoA ligase [Bacillus sp. FJAT-50079]